MSQPENVAENFSGSFREKQFQGQNIHYLVNNLERTGSLLDKIPDGNGNVLTEEALDDIGAKFETSPRKSLNL
jgi:hypothetical protein